MAQLRRDYEQFRALSSEVLMVVPNGPKMIERYLKAHATPYPILSDKGARVAAQYGIELRGAIILPVYPPSVFLVDRAGKIRYVNYQSSYILEPDLREPQAVLAQLAA